MWTLLILSMEVRIVYTDGSEDQITAEDGFKVADHPVVMSNVYGSEVIDGRLEQKGWSEPGFDDLAWKPALTAKNANLGRFVEQFQPPVKVLRSYEEKLLHESLMGHIIEWYYGGIARIQPLEPGFHSIEIRPYLPDTMGEFTCEYHSASGCIQVHVKESEDEILLETCIADGITYHIDTESLRKAGKEIKIQSGKAAFVSEEACEHGNGIKALQPGQRLL